MLAEQKATKPVQGKSEEMMVYIVRKHTRKKYCDMFNLGHSPASAYLPQVLADNKYQNV